MDNAFYEMRQEQKQFWIRVKKERHLDPEDVDNIKAIHHELVEYEHGTPWKWWKEGTDAHKHMEEKHDGLTDYLAEEVVDVWHFLLQELIISEEVDIQSTDLEDWWKEYDAEEVPIKGMREHLVTYEMALESNHIEGAHRALKAFSRKLIALSKENGLETTEQLYEKYSNKNDENHERQDGEVDGREEYEAE